MGFSIDMFLGSCNFNGFEIPYVVIIICLIILGISIKELVDFSSKIKPLETGLKTFNDFLSHFDSELNRAQCQEISSFLNKGHFFENQWSEFSETIILGNEDESTAYNTEQSENYFNKTSLLEYSIDTNHFTSIPGVLTGIGLLGTFISILIGLYHVHIEGTEVTGIEELINGLSGKFISSILGLSTSIIFNSFLNQHLRNIENQIFKLQHKLNSLFARNLSEKTMLKISDTLEKLLEEVENTNKIKHESTDFDGTNGLTDQIKGLRADLKDDLTKTISTLTNINREIIENLTDQFKFLRTESNDSNERIISVLESNFKLTNEKLTEAVKTLSKGATEEIIAALQQVIKDFNDNLTEQFGENFKELNNAVYKLVDWQENYKSSIEQIEKTLNASTDNLSAIENTLGSISSRNQEVIDVYDQLKTTLESHRSEIELINNRMDEYSKLHSQVSENIKLIKQSFNQTLDDLKNNSTKFFNDATKAQINLYESFDEASRTILKDTQVHIKENAKTILDSLENSQSQISSISEKIQTSISNQSESLSQLSNSLPEHSQIINQRLSAASEEIEKQLTESLGQMERALVGLTNKFKENYDATLKTQVNN